MNHLFILINVILLVGCYKPETDDKALLWEIEMMTKEWDRLEDPQSKKKAQCFSKCNDQPASCYYKCSNIDNVEENDEKLIDYS